MRNLGEELQLALHLVEGAAEVALAHLGRGNASRTKDDGSPVTDADIEVERQILEHLTQERPDDAMLGEEFGAVAGRSGWCWLIDPIDGTWNYTSGRDEWGTHVALSDRNELVLGVISRPASRSNWWATKGGGAFSSSPNGGVVRLAASRQSALSESRATVWIEGPSRDVDAVKRHARWVTPTLDSILEVAEGKLEAVIDPGGHPWDHAPAVVIVEEAGGRFFDRYGGRRIDQGHVRFTNGHIDEALRDLLKLEGEGGFGASPL